MTIMRPLMQRLLTTDLQVRILVCFYITLFLIDVLENGISGKAAELLHIHAYLCLCLRNAVSLFTRVNITDEQVLELKQHCTNFYRGY